MTRVACDSQGLTFDGVPALVQAGALHYARLPHPDLWPPVLMRLRMAGFNAVSLVIPWAYHSPAPGFYDFTGPRDLRRLADEAMRAGLWLLLQIGPWSGADMEAAGLPAWFLAEAAPSPPFSPNAAALRAIGEWWGRLLAHFRAQPNLAAVALDGGGPLPASLLTLAERLVDGVAPVLVRTPVAEGSAPPDALWCAPSGAPLLAEIAGGHPLVWGGDARARILAELGEEHPCRLIAHALNAAAGGYVLNPAHGGVNWSYWGAPSDATAWGIGAPVAEGSGLPPAYSQTRRAVLLAETLGATLRAAVGPGGIHASAPECLLGSRRAAETTVAFLAAEAAPVSVQLTHASGDDIHTSEPLALPAHATRLLPLEWPLAGGRLHLTTLEPLLRMTVAGRWLLLLVNDGGGDVLLSDDFRPRHARGAVRTQRREGKLALRFEAGRLASLLLDGPTGPLQVLALEAALAARVWPLDDTWRSGPAFQAAWSPAAEDPARGLVIGPDLVAPHADGSFAYAVSGKGSGYRWGPWRGSDPQTWLAPLTWGTPRLLRPPELRWVSLPGAPEVALEYDDRAWTRVAAEESLAAAATPGRGMLWYRGRFRGAATELRLRLRHAGDVFFNGKHLAALNEPLSRETPGWKTLPLPPALLRPDENLLVLLVESLGRSAEWAAVTQPVGLLEAELDSGAPLTWRIREGLCGERAVQGFAGFAEAALLPAEADAHITWQRAEFALDWPAEVEATLTLTLERTPAKATIYLNGQMVGRYWEAFGPQRRFWLPGGLLRTRGQNELLIAQWTRGAAPGLGAVGLEIGAALVWQK